MNNLVVSIQDYVSCLYKYIKIPDFYQTIVFSKAFIPIQHRHIIGGFLFLKPHCVTNWCDDPQLSLQRIVCCGDKIYDAVTYLVDISTLEMIL